MPTIAFLRRFLLYVFIVAYLVVCPLVIFYALGYIYQPGGDYGLTKTGVISIATVPAGASVYLGKSRYTETTPTVLIGLFPGTYPVRIYLSGHRAWLRDVPVLGGKAVVLEKILLLPSELKPLVLESDSFNRLMPIMGTPYLLLKKGPLAGDVYMYNWKKQKIHPLFSPSDPLGRAKMRDYFVARESEFLIVHIEKEEGARYFLRTNLKETPPVWNVLDGLSPERPVEITWDAAAESRLFYEPNGYLKRFDISSGLTTSVTDGINGYGLFDKKVYVVKNHDVFRTDENGKSMESLLGDTSLGRELFEEESSLRIEALDDGILLFLKQNGELISNRFPYRLVEKGIVGLEPLNGEPAVLIWRDDAIGMLDFSERMADRQESFQKAVKLTWLFSGGQKIRQVFWVHDGSHVLFLDWDKLFLMDAYPYGTPEIRFLLSVREESLVFYSESSGTVFYLDAGTGNVCSLELVPKAEILSTVTAGLPREGKDAARDAEKNGFRFFPAQT